MILCSRQILVNSQLLESGRIGSLSVGPNDRTCLAVHVRSNYQDPDTFSEEDRNNVEREQPFRLLTPHFQMASSYISQQCIIFDSTERHLNIRSFLLETSEYPDFSALRASQFEQLVHLELSVERGNWYFEAEPFIVTLDNAHRVTSIQRNSARKVWSLNFSRMVHSRQTMPYSKAAFFQLIDTHAAYNGTYIPASKDFTTIDAILTPNILLQCAVNKSHPIKVAGLIETVNRLRQHVPTEVILRQYIAVPSDIFSVFRLTPEDFDYEGVAEGSGLPENMTFWIVNYGIGRREKRRVSLIHTIT